MVQNSDAFISVVVTTYNRKELLKETIDSILNQTYTNFELLVVDNNSNYDFFDLMESFEDSRIHAYQNDNKGIIAVNRNFGIKKSKGAYIAFCDDDDVWYPQKLKTQLTFFNDEELIGIGCTYDVFQTSSESVQFSQKIRDRKFDYREILINNSGVALSSLLIKNKNFLFEESQTYFAIEDFAFQILMCFQTKKKILRLGRPLLKYRKHANNNSSITQLIKCGKLIEQYKDVLSDRDVKKAYQIYYYQLGKGYFKLEDVENAEHYFMASLKHGFQSSKYTLKIITRITRNMLKKYTSI
ncbi:MAG: glycosyltransferase family 2 protein [Bacteroidales bacterium]|nr:glycosyltransferase family 2 protein [Bacteroidales bacterium]